MRKVNSGNLFFICGLSPLVVQKIYVCVHMERDFISASTHLFVAGLMMYIHIERLQYTKQSRSDC